MDLHAIELKEELPRVNTAATLFQAMVEIFYNCDLCRFFLLIENDNLNLITEYCYQYRDHFSAGILCCGYDDVEGGQGTTETFVTCWDFCLVYSIPLGGMKIRQPVSIGGSGSTWIYGLVDQQYKKGMSKEECIK